MRRKQWHVISLTINFIFLAGCFADIGTGNFLGVQTPEEESIGDNFSISSPLQTSTTSIPITISPNETMEIESFTVDASSVSCKSNSNWRSYTGVNTVNVLSENTTNNYYLKFKSTKGKVSNCKLFSVVHDNIEPILSEQIAQSAPASGLGISKGPILSSSAIVDTGSGVNKIEVQVREYLGNKLIEDWQEITPGTGIESLSLVAGKEYYYQARITDGADNISPRYALPPWSSRGINRDSKLATPVYTINVDIDGDGDEDILTVDDTTTFLWENLGNGKLMQIVLGDGNITFNSNAQTLNYADYDGDGDLDIVSSTIDNSSTRKIVIYRNDSDLQFTELDTGLSPGSNYFGITFIDIDSDGDQDILYSSTSELILLTNNSGSFSSSSFRSSYSRNLRVAELNGDNYPELIYTGFLDGTLYIHNGSAGGYSSTPSQSIADVNGSSNYLFVVADLDGDNDLDIIHNNYTGGNDSIVYRKNNGSGVFSVSTITTISGNFFNRVNLAYNNDDTRLDVLVYGSDQVHILNQAEDGSFSHISGSPFTGTPGFSGVINGTSQSYFYSTSYSYQENSPYIHGLDTNLIGSAAANDFWKPYKYIKVTDVNNDGKNDLIGLQHYHYSVDTKIYVHYDYVNSAEKTLVYTIPQPQTIYGFDAADMDGDGDKDFAVSLGYSKAIYILRNDGLSNFTDMTNFSEGHMVNPVINDVDGDGDMDVVCKRESDDYLVGFINDGSMNFSFSVLIASDIDTIVYRLFDYDKDGDVDLFGKSGNTVVLQQNNFGTFATATTFYDNSSAYSNFQFVDFDKDGDFDIYLDLYNFMGTSVVSRAMNDGSNNFTKTDIASNSSYSLLPVGQAMDVDNDGDVDIIKRSDSQLSFWENDGSFNFTESVLSNNIRGGTDFIMADFDGDNKAEIFAPAETTNSVLGFEFN
ncbi:MAG: VCBS repeat-containing protein [Bdellovibrionota bacterium]|nr:VCBS repeat-containing protein [Bdellovibrionota bacterium]